VRRGKRVSLGEEKCL